MCLAYDMEVLAKSEIMSIVLFTVRCLLWHNMLARFQLLNYDLTFIDIAASAYGREYLSSCAEGKEFIKNMCSVLATAPLSEEW